MLHPTKVPDCEAVLQLLLDLQEHLLDLARVNVWQTLVNVQASIAATFPPDVAQWLDAHHEKFLDRLIPISRLSQAKKEALVGAFQHDRQFPLNAQNPTFQFELVADGVDKDRELVKTWLTGFYNQFAEGGFPACLSGGDHEFCKKDWVKAYQRANHEGMTCTCSACDGTLAGGLTIDHYFPRSRYPALSLHPHNFLPICTSCNNDKGDLDPLEGRAITDIFLPYLRHVRETARLTFTSQPTAKERIAFEAMPPDDNTTIRLQALATLFNIPQQWQKNVDEICELAERRARARIKSARDDGRTVDETTLVALIDSAVNMMEEDWGLEHHLYPATEWLRWAKVNKPDFLTTLLPVR
jgi:hypothetical protein